MNALKRARSAGAVVCGWLVVGTAFAAWAQPPHSYSVAKPSTVTYTVVHKLHKVTGVCASPEGKARVQPDGSVQVQVRAPVECFDSGNANRDAHMKETVEAARFPQVELRGVAPAGSVKPDSRGVQPIPLVAKLSFHGQERQFNVKLNVTFAEPNRAVAEGEFPISLDDFKVERPSLMFVKVDDQSVIQVKLSFEAAR